MAENFTITAENNRKIFRDTAFKGEAKTYSFNLSPWAEENSTVTTATWSIETGNASVSGQALTSNVASALVTFGEEGGNLIKVTADSGTEIYIIYLDVLVKDPKRQTDDYGLCCG